MLSTILTSILIPGLFLSSLLSYVSVQKPQETAQPKAEFAQVLPDAFISGNNAEVLSEKQEQQTPAEEIASLLATPTPVVSDKSSDDLVAQVVVTPTPTASEPTAIPSVTPTIVSTVSTAPAAPSSYDTVYQEAGARYGIPWQILYGLHITETGGRDGAVMNGSGSGARGPMQFMPGTWRAYGVDGNGDGVADIDNAVDAIHGAANYLALHGSLDNGLRSYGGNMSRTLELAQARGYSQ